MLWLFGKESSGPICTMRQTGRAQQWPQSLKDLLPHGPENAMCGLINLFTLDLTPCIKRTVHGALDVILRLAHPIVKQYLANSSTFVLRGICASVTND